MINGTFTVLIFEDSPDTGRSIFNLAKSACPDAQIAWFRRIGAVAPEMYHNLEPSFVLRLDFILNSDVIIFDLQIPTGPGPEWSMEQCEGGLEGAAFIRKYRNQFSPETHVCMWTAFDPQTASLDDLTVPRENVLSKVDSGPYFHKWSKDTPQESLVGHLVKQLYEWRYQRRRSSEAFRQVWFAAQHELPVLIVGESGTGKELIAEWIHELWSSRQRTVNRQRPNWPFRPVNCAQLTVELARGELFGHVRGAYTGATSAKIGECLQAAGIAATPTPPRGRGDAASGEAEYRDFLLSQYANVLEAYDTDEANEKGYGELDIAFRINKDRKMGEQECLGTLFLDEFGDLPIEVQSMLLRYLNSFEVQPNGYGGLIRGAKVRVIAATSDPRVARLVGFGEKEFGGLDHGKDPFREDLVYRVAGQTIRTKQLTGRDAVALVEMWASDRNMFDWSKDAKQLLKKRVDVAVKRPGFGHKRELRRLFDLTQHWAKCAPGMGVKAPRTITEQMIEAWWKPAPIPEAEAELLASGAEPISPSASESRQPTGEPVRMQSRAEQEFQSLNVRLDDAAVILRAGTHTDTLPLSSGQGRVVKLLLENRGKAVTRETLCGAYFEPDQKVTESQRKRTPTDVASALNKRLEPFGVQVVAVKTPQVGGHGRRIYKTTGFQLTISGDLTGDSVSKSGE